MANIYIKMQAEDYMAILAARWPNAHRLINLSSDDRYVRFEILGTIYATEIDSFIESVNETRGNMIKFLNILDNLADLYHARRPAGDGENRYIRAWCEITGGWIRIGDMYAGHISDDMYMIKLEEYLAIETAKLDEHHRKFAAAISILPMPIRDELTEYWL